MTLVIFLKLSVMATHLTLLFLITTIIK